MIVEIACIELIPVCFVFQSVKAGVEQGLTAGYLAESQVL